MTINAGRYTADLSGSDDDIVVALFGMRVSKPWQLRRWVPVFAGMSRMLRYLDRHPQRGLLGYRRALFPALAFEPMVIQYWRSFADLERFARHADDPHLKAWRSWNRTTGKNGDLNTSMSRTSSSLRRSAAGAG